MKIFVSQPMNGKSREEIESVFQEAVYDIRTRLSGLTSDPIEILSTRNYVLPKNLARGRNERIACLSHAIEVMSRADIVYFCEGAEMSAGCASEHAIAKIYGLTIMRPEGLPL